MGRGAERLPVSFEIELETEHEWRNRQECNHSFALCIKEFVSVSVSDDAIETL